MHELLVSGDLLLASADAPPLPHGAVLIAGGGIAAVGERSALRRAHPGATEVGGDGMLVLPGLINAHHHGMAISTVQLGFPDPSPPGNAAATGRFCACAVAARYWLGVRCP